MAPRAWTPNGLGIFWVSIALLGLFFIEPLVSRRSYFFKTPETTSPLLREIPLKSELEVVLSGGVTELQNKKLTSFQNIVNSSPSKLLLINFWATWCDPCVEEIPSLNWLSRQLKETSGMGLPSFVTVSVDEKRQSIFQLEKTLENRLDFPVLHDPDGKFSRTLGISKFPETFLVDSEGAILYKWIGPQDWQSQETIKILASFAKQ